MKAGDDNRHICKRGVAERLMHQHRIVVVALICVVVYIAAYGVCLHNKEPAANLRYFCYVSDPTLDHVLYAFFYPAYWLHKMSHVPGFVKHNLDRSKVVQPLNAV